LRLVFSVSAWFSDGAARPLLYKQLEELSRIDNFGSLSQVNYVGFKQKIF